LAGATTDLEVIFKEPLSNLTVIPSGPIPPNPSELLGSSRMHDLISNIKSRFDIIIWDSPPLMTVTDGLILSKLLDATIIVVKAGKTTYEIVSRGLKILKGRRETDVAARVIGMVINAFDIKKADKDYYYYNYYTYYTSEKKKVKVK
jgi:capsular exopolysaccharide synthesis family protein